MSAPPVRAGRVATHRWWSWAVGGVAAVTLLVVGLGELAIARRDGDVPAVVEGADVVFVVALLSNAAVGVALLRRRPDHPVGWCFALFAMVLCADALIGLYARWGLWVEPSSLPAAREVAAVGTAMWVPWMPLMALIWSLTPNGHHLSPRWRRANVALAVLAAVWLVHGFGAPGRLDPPYEEVTNPWAASWHQPWLQDALSVVCIGLVVVALVSPFVRYHRARGDERRRMTWMAVVAGPVAVLVALSAASAIAGQASLAQAFASGFIALPPLGAWLAITRHRLYEVDRVLSRTVTYTLVSLALIAVFGVTIVVTARLLGQTVSRSPTASAVATLVAVVVARPLYRTAQDAVDRRFARQRHATIARLHAALGDPGAPPVEQVLADVLGVDIDVRYPLLDTGEWITSDGRRDRIDDSWQLVGAPDHRIAAVRHDGDGDGHDATTSAVLAAARPALERAALQATIAHHLAEIAASRQRLARAQDVERSRIERDLHDGALARLLGVAAHLQAALVNGSPEQMSAGLALGVEACRAAVADLRALANGLVPASLAAGLDDALEELVARFPARLEIETRGRRYATASELTIWFVAAEALANAMKHGGEGTTMAVRVAVRGDWLDLVIDDDGSGGADPDGHGLRGLADRVEAVGGHLTVVPRPDRGTRVRAVVPCAS